MPVMRALSVFVGRPGAAAGAEVLGGLSRSAGRVFPTTVRAVALTVVVLALAAFAALIPASEAPNAQQHSSAGSTANHPAAASQMSEQEAQDAYEKLPLSFVPNEG